METLPAGSISFDRRNNVEQIIWNDIPTGNVDIIIRAHRIIAEQTYALVIKNYD